MAAPMVAGAAAIGFQLDPTMTPNRAKALLRDSDRPLTDSIDELSMVDAARRFFNDGGRLANQGLEPNTYIDPATGEIDYTRSRWSRSRWSEAGELLRSSWSRSSWSLAPDRSPADAAAAADPTRRAGAAPAGAARAGRPAGPSNACQGTGEGAARPGTSLGAP